MRVISGRARGHKLFLVPGATTRPMMDRVKENLFNILGPNYVPGTRWLDLFAGTGQVGIEALSRGAREVVFLDTANAAIATIHRNLKHTRLTEGAMVICIDAFAYLRSRDFEPFDVIFVAPPQYKGIWASVLRELNSYPAGFLSDDGIIVVQIDPREWKNHDLELKRLFLYDQRTYGNTMLCFYERTQL